MEYMCAYKYICICSSVFEVVTFENYPLTQGDYGPFVSHIITNIYWTGSRGIAQDDHRHSGSFCLFVQSFDITGVPTSSIMVTIISLLPSLSFLPAQCTNTSSHRYHQAP